MDPRELAYAGAAEQARLLAAGTVTAPALLDVYLDRITRLDPELRSYRVILTDSARREAAVARRADRDQGRCRRRRRGHHLRHQRTRARRHSGRRGGASAA